MSLAIFESRTLLGPELRRTRVMGMSSSMISHESQWPRMTMGSVRIFNAKDKAVVSCYKGTIVVPISANEATLLGVR